MITATKGKHLSGFKTLNISGHQHINLRRVTHCNSSWCTTRSTKLNCFIILNNNLVCGKDGTKRSAFTSPNIASRGLCEKAVSHSAKNYRKSYAVMAAYKHNKTTQTSLLMDIVLSKVTQWYFHTNQI